MPNPPAPDADTPQHAASPTGITDPLTPRAFSCRCGRPIFFRNTACLACGLPLGYDPEGSRLMALEPADGPAGLWREAGAGPMAPAWRRCANLLSATHCNWLVGEPDAAAGLLCRCCRLTRTLPDLALASNAQRWNLIELAKRRLVSSLLGLKLPLRSKVSEDPDHGLLFDFLESLPGANAVVTGHHDGVITLDVEEADDATRERRRSELGEPYRTLLGHLRHECGHYYWQRLVMEGSFLDAFRALFGDEREDYAAALQRHYASGGRADWPTAFVSAYAASHPWEDWAETWAHYLHMRDTVDTARSFGFDGGRVELSYERFTIDTLARPGDLAVQPDFLPLLNTWIELTGVLNELSRSMGVQDFYPFVLAAPAVRKLHFVHCVVATGQGG